MSPDIDGQIKQLSLEEKAALCVGMNFWMTKNISEKGVRPLFLSDGPHGIRKQDVKNADHLGINESHHSVCYPTACAAACTWDRELIEEMGECLGREAKDMGVDILHATIGHKTVLLVPMIMGDHACGRRGIEGLGLEVKNNQTGAMEGSFIPAVQKGQIAVVCRELGMGHEMKGVVHGVLVLKR